MALSAVEVVNFAEPVQNKCSDQWWRRWRHRLTITQEQFKEACMKDAFKDVQVPQ